jgi:signal transduction histidine kinase
MVLSEKEYVYLIIIVAIGFSLLLAFFLSLLYLNVRIKKKKEIEKLNAIIETQEYERQRIAADIHDEIGPLLSSIKLNINNIENTNLHITRFDLISQTSNQLDNVIQRMRTIVRNLSLEKSGQPGLFVCIEEYKILIEKNGIIKFDFDHSVNLHPLSEMSETNIYRIISELINNSIKHSNCNLIKLTLNCSIDALEIFYSDNGHNVISKYKSEGMGLKNINKRVELLNGKIKSSSTFTNGAKYKITFPINAISEINS